MSRRTKRVGEQLKREIAGLLRAQVSDPRIGLVTVTSVDVSPDLTFARVWVQLTGDDEQRRKSVEGLAAAAPFVRRQLGSILTVRRVPELDFREDHTLERALRIESLLREVGETLAPSEEEVAVDEEPDLDEEADGDEEPDVDEEPDEEDPEEHEEV